LNGDGSDPARYRLRLFIAGSAPRSRRTIENLRRICAKHLADGFDLEVVDIYQQPEIAKADRIVAAPTLLKLAPLPARQIIGDLSDEARVLRGLGISTGIGP
jgi:circadian clock protein KaiB